MTDDKREKPQESDAERFEPTGNDVTFKFENREAASNFLHWLCGLGEQDYWNWMELREKDEPGPITGTRFDYHEPGHGTVIVTCGRLDDPER